MKYTKQVSVGSFLTKGEDFKEGDLIEVASEGKQVDGKYGMQDLFMVKTTDGKEGNVGFNQTTINCLIDAFGDDSKNWIGKKAKVWAILSNIQGKMKKVYYFTHPDAELDDEGGFKLVNVGTTPAPTEENKEEIKVEDIPFLNGTYLK